MDSSNFQPPVRRSLSNEELEARVNQAMSAHSGLEAVMELLVAEEALRSQEAAELSAWRAQMREIGTPEALKALADSENPGSASTSTELPEAIEPQVESVTPQSIQVDTQQDSEPEEVSSWFTAPVVESAIEDPIQQPAPIAQEEVVTPVEPFSWFTQTNDDDEQEKDASTVSEEIITLEISAEETHIESLPSPAGSESQSDFEALLAAAAAEEELTALEETKPEEAVPSAKTELLPSKRSRTNRNFGKPILFLLGLIAIVAPLGLVWALISYGITSTGIAITIGSGVLIAISLIAFAVIVAKRNDRLPETKNGTATTSDNQSEQTLSAFLNSANQERETDKKVSERSSEANAVESNVLIPSDENRNRGFSSQILIWLGVSATIAPILLVWALVHLGLSAAAIAIVLSVGYLISGTLIGVAAIAGKRSGQPTGVISRAIYGVWGNAVPNSFMFIARVVVTALLIGLFAFLMNGIEVRIPEFKTVLTSLGGVNLTTGLLVQTSVLIAATALALVRGNSARVIQVLFSLLAFMLVLESFFSFAGTALTFQTSGTVGLFSITALSGVGLIVLANLTAWFSIAPNLAKAIPGNVRGYKVFMAAFVSNFVAPVLVGILSLLWLGQISMSAPAGFSIQEAVLMMPKWAQGSLASGVAIALVYAVTLSIRSAALDLVAIFRLKGRVLAVAITVAVVFGLMVLFVQQPSSQEIEYLSNMLLVVAAVSAGWVGIFVADVLVRKLAYHELSLARAYGVYKKVNILSLCIWLVTLVAAVALMPVNLYGMSFMGFAISSLGLDLTLATAALGFVATALLGFLLTVLIRIPQVRKQEAELAELEARREQLNDIFVSAD
jgi:purine-cytosine permease-like protein